jgi:putative transcriptional regulator
MDKKLTGRALTAFEAERDVWQEVLDGVKEIRTGGGKRKKAVSPRPRRSMIESTTPPLRRLR